jgi:hypothetical protein
MIIKSLGSTCISSDYSLKSILAWMLKISRKCVRSFMEVKWYYYCSEFISEWDIWRTGDWANLAESKQDHKRSSRNVLYASYNQRKRTKLQDCISLLANILVFWAVKENTETCHVLNGLCGVCEWDITDSTRRFNTKGVQLGTKE